MQITSVHVNTEKHWRGGEQQTLRLVDGLRRRGHRAILVTRPDSPLAMRAGELDTEIFPIRPVNEGDPRAVWSLSRLLRRCRPCLLHMHAPHAHLLGAMAALLVSGVPRLVTRRVLFSIYRRGTLRLNWFKYRFGADHYIAISHAVRDALVGHGIPAHRITVIHSGVPAPVDGEQESAPDPRRELGLPAGQPLVLCAGNLEWNKGQMVLLEAAARILERRPVAFLFAGEGPDRAALELRARALGIAGDVRWLGFREDLGALLARTDVYAQPSLCEGLGTTVLEALGRGVPTVACASGGMPEIMENGRHGLLVEPGNPVALATAILELLGDPERAGTLARAGRRRVEAEFSVDRMVESTLALYGALHGRGGVAPTP